MFAGEDENLDAESDDSEGIEIDETTQKKKSPKAKKSTGRYFHGISGCIQYFLVIRCFFLPKLSRKSS